MEMMYGRQIVHQSLADGARSAIFGENELIRVLLEHPKNEGARSIYFFSEQMENLDGWSIFETPHGRENAHLFLLPTLYDAGKQKRLEKHKELSTLAANVRADYAGRFPFILGNTFHNALHNMIRIYDLAGTIRNLPIER